MAVNKKLAGAASKSEWKIQSAVAAIDSGDTPPPPPMQVVFSQEKVDDGFDDTPPPPTMQKVVKADDGVDTPSPMPPLLTAIFQSSMVSTKQQNPNFNSHSKPILQQPAPNHYIPQFAAPLQYYPPPQYSPQFHIPIPPPPIPPLQYSYHFQTGAFPIADGRPMISGGGPPPMPMLPTTATNQTNYTPNLKPPLPEFRGDGYYFLPTGSGWKKVPYSDVIPCEIPRQPSPVVNLRANVVRQIEYYFCDENMKDDYYLISLMDSQGWVPISKIAEFKMIKRMNVGIPFILNALESSKTIQVQSEKIRRRNDGSRWLPASR